MTGKNDFTYQEVESYFTDKVILNYLNEMLLEAFHVFNHMLKTKGGQIDALFGDIVPGRMRNITHLNEAKR